MTPSWVSELRSILELSYFAANIAMAIAVWLGLNQLGLTKKIATKNAKRESLKFAAERCQYYAEHCVDLHSRVVNEHHRLGLTFLKPPLPSFSIVDGEIKPERFDEAALAQQYTKISSLIWCLNSLEAFAIPFAAGVADDEIGFQETAAAFCAMVEPLIGVIFLLRRLGNRYESTVKIYDRWKSRLVAQNLEGKMKQIQEQHKAVAEKGKVKVTDPFL
jgi:hypothetical protein